MTQRELILWSMIIAGASLPVPAATQHFAISNGIIAAVISQTGLEIAPEQVSLLTEVVATTPAPVLKVRSIEKLDKQRLLARMECENRDECLPFFVSIQVGQSSATQTFMSSTKASATDTAPQSSVKSVVLHVGSMATLQLDGDHVHIRIPVICLESGSPGQTIRATDKNHRVVYSAQVIDGSLVKGRLQ